MSSAKKSQTASEKMPNQMKKKPNSGITRNLAFFKYHSSQHGHSYLLLAHLRCQLCVCHNFNLTICKNYGMSLFPFTSMNKKNIKNTKAALGIQNPFESRYVIFVHISQTQVFLQVSLRFNSKQEIHLIFKVVPVVAKRNRFLFWAVPRSVEGGQGGHCQGARPARPCQLFHDSLFIECTSMYCTPK